ncbi:MAG TPA: glycosyltransferase family 2 protein [Terriglobales bacterium]
MIWWWAWGGIEFATWAWYVGQAFVGIRKLPDLTTEPWISAAHDRTHWPSLLVVVPARNEQEDIAHCLESLIRSNYPALHVIAVDDRSTDTTGGIMASLAAAHPERLTVLHVSDLPEGWLGKTHAMWLAAQKRVSDYILFTDGDVFFHPDALARAVHCAEVQRADHLVLFPNLITKSIGERMMISLFQTLFIFEHRAWKASDPKSKDHIGVGAFNLVRRSAYDAIGTYQRLRLAILDDMKLGERIKHAGLRQRVAYGRDLVRVHWLEGTYGIIRGLTKNAFAVANFRVSVLLFQIVGMLYILLGPYAGALLAPGWAKAPFLVTIALIWSLYAGISLASDIGALYMFTHPLGALLFIYAMIRSTVITLARGGIEWRGTRYSLAEIRRSQT